MKAQSTFEPIRKDGKLLCRFDATRDLIEIKRDGVVHVVDLAQERQRAQSTLNVKSVDNNEQRG